MGWIRRNWVVVVLLTYVAVVLVYDVLDARTHGVDPNRQLYIVPFVVTIFAGMVYRSTNRSSRIG